MTHPLAPFVKVVLEKAAARALALADEYRNDAVLWSEDKMPKTAATVVRCAEALDHVAATIRALDADKIAAENAHLVPGMGEVERLRKAIISDTGPDLGAESREPSLQSIICHHYARWFPENEAIALTDRYLFALQETRHDR